MLLSNKSYKRRIKKKNQATQRNSRNAAGSEERRAPRGEWRKGLKETEEGRV